MVHVCVHDIVHCATLKIEFENRFTTPIKMGEVGNSWQHAILSCNNRFKGVLSICLNQNSIVFRYQRGLLYSKARWHLQA